MTLRGSAATGAGRENLREIANLRFGWFPAHFANPACPSPRRILVKGFCCEPRDSSEELTGRNLRDHPRTHGNIPDRTFSGIIFLSVIKVDTDSGNKKLSGRRGIAQRNDRPDYWPIVDSDSADPHSPDVLLRPWQPKSHCCRERATRKFRQFYWREKRSALRPSWVLKRNVHD